MRAPPAWALRCGAALALRRGYIHPDEWWQSGEAAARAWLSLATPFAWEFAADAPARSALVPLLAVGPPLALLRLLGAVTPAALVAAPRVYLALAAGVVPRRRLAHAARRCARARGRHPP